MYLLLKNVSLRWSTLADVKHHLIELTLIRKGVRWSLLSQYGENVAKATFLRKIMDFQMGTNLNLFLLNCLLVQYNLLWLTEAL